LALFSTLALLLHLGNLNFAKQQGKDAATIPDKQKLGLVSEFLGCIEAPILVEKALCSRSFMSATRRSFYSIPLTVEQAIGKELEFSK